MTNKSATMPQKIDEVFDEPSIDLLDEKMIDKRAKAVRLAPASSECPFDTDRARLLQAASIEAFQKGRGTKIRVDFFIFLAVMFAICFVLGIPIMALVYALGINAILLAFKLRNVSSDHFKGMFFIIDRRPFGVGDLIEIDPSETSVNFKRENVCRVIEMNVSHTVLVSLGFGGPTWFPNQGLVNRKITNWSWVPVSFQIHLEVPVDTCDALLFLRNFHEKVKQYANDKSSKWFPIDTTSDDAIKEGNEYTEYRVEIRHRESWQQYKLVLLSKSELTEYCLEQAKTFSLKEAKRCLSALPKAVGDNSKGSGDDNADNGNNNDKNKKNDVDHKIEYTEEKTEEREEGGGKMEEEEDEGELNDEYDDRRIDYDISIE